MTTTELYKTFKFGVGDSVKLWDNEIYPEGRFIHGVVTEVGDDTFCVQWKDLTEDTEYEKSDYPRILHDSDFDLQYDEEKEVQALCARIGYGRVMQLASQLWSKMLISEHGLPGSGAFVPAIHFQIKKSEQKELAKEYPDAFPPPTTLNNTPAK